MKSQQRMLKIEANGGRSSVGVEIYLVFSWRKNLFIEEMLCVFHIIIIIISSSSSSCIITIIIITITVEQTDN